MPSCSRQPSFRMLQTQQTSFNNKPPRCKSMIRSKLSPTWGTSEEMADVEGNDGDLASGKEGMPFKYIKYENSKMGFKPICDSHQPEMNLSTKWSKKTGSFSSLVGLMSTLIIGECVPIGPQAARPRATSWEPLCYQTIVWSWHICNNIWRQNALCMRVSQ